MGEKKLKIAFDLDGVLASFPPLVPKFILTWLTKGWQGDLHYRLPGPFWCNWLRQISHYWYLRRPKTRNLAALKKLKEIDQAELYIVSGRFNFLTGRTKDWFRHWLDEDIFENILINENDMPPHIFKKETLSSLGVDYYFEDDEEIVEFLKGHGFKVFLVKKDGDLKRALANALS